MSGSWMVPAVTAAVSVGLGCGTCCSPIISTFLSTYVVSHAGGVKKGIVSFICFFFGKMVSVSLLCMVSALVSRQFISESGYIGSCNLRLVSQVAMSVIGAVMMIRWFMESGRKKCGGCKECGKKEGRSGYATIFLAGFFYGMTPCAPLLLMVGYCFTLPVAAAGMTGILFSLASMASPVLLLVMITGELSKKMSREIPHAVKWFRLASYMLLTVIPFILSK